MPILFAVIWGSFVIAIVDAGRREQAKPADAIVVLGAAQYEGRPSPVLKARLDHACGSVVARAGAARDRDRGARRRRHDERGCGRDALPRSARRAGGFHFDGHTGADDEPIHGSGASPAWDEIVRYRLEDLPQRINSERPVSYAASRDPGAATSYDSATITHTDKSHLDAARPTAAIRFGRVGEGPYAMVVGAH